MNLSPDTNHNTIQLDGGRKKKRFLLFESHICSTDPNKSYSQIP